jgi:50S ribosomal protein L16 3-hydroxylase
MQILKALLGETSLDTFLSKNFTRMPFSMPDRAKPLESYLDWSVVQKVLESKKAILRVVKDGNVTIDSEQMGFEEAMNYYHQGNTLVLRYAEKGHSLLKSLADDFAASFRTEVDIQLYCTPEGHNAFGWHYDIEEVFVIQTKGSKEYTIRPNTVHPRPLLSSVPKNMEYEKETGEQVLKVMMQAGDWLYIPSGWWHVAKTQSESMHISVGLMPRSAIDVLEVLPKFLAKNSYWRSRLPVHKNFPTPEEEIAFYQDAMMSLGADLKHQIASPEFIKFFLEEAKKRSNK